MITYRMEHPVSSSSLIEFIEFSLCWNGSVEKEVSAKFWLKNCTEFSNTELDIDLIDPAFLCSLQLSDGFGIQICCTSFSLKLSLCGFFSLNGSLGFLIFYIQITSTGNKMCALIY